MTSLPLHPLIVHLPVVLIPLVTLLVMPSVVSRRWFEWSAPLTLVLSFAAVLGAWAGTWSGEALEEAQGATSALLEHHAQLGELTRNLAALLFALCLAATALYWGRSPAALRVLGERRPVLYRLLTAAGTLVGLVAVVVAVQAGHAGAELVWQGRPGS